MYALPLHCLQRQTSPADRVPFPPYFERGPVADGATIMGLPDTIDGGNFFSQCEQFSAYLLMPAPQDGHLTLLVPFPELSTGDAEERPSRTFHNHNNGLR